MSPKYSYIEISIWIFSTHLIIMHLENGDNPEGKIDKDFEIEEKRLTISQRRIELLDKCLIKTNLHQDWSVICAHSLVVVCKKLRSSSCVLWSGQVGNSAVPEAKAIVPFMVESDFAKKSRRMGNAGSHTNCFSQTQMRVGSRYGLT